MCAELLSHIQLFATPWTLAHQATLSVGFLQARILEWDAIAFCEYYAAAAAAKSLQSCPTLCDPIDRSPSGSPVPATCHLIIGFLFFIGLSWRLRGKKKKKNAGDPGLIPGLGNPLGKEMAARASILS